jgi:hypothetical protein
MLSRKTQSEPGILLPEEWRENLEGLLISIYKERDNFQGKTFEVFAYTYPNEVILLVSLLDQKDSMVIPITYKVSADLKEKEDPKKILEALVDSVGVFFDHVLNTPNWVDYLSTWEESVTKGQKIFISTSRENIGLTLQADELLKD